MGKQAGSEDRTIEGLGEELRRAVGRFVRAVRTDVGTPQSARGEALALFERRGAMNIASLAHLRKVKHQTMQLIVGQLESDGLVVRTADPNDRRSRLFSLTAAGHDALVRDRQIRASRIDQLLRTHVSGEEQALLTRAIALLDRISAATER